MRALLPLIVVVLLAGCGHKGPLYLPKPKPDAKKPPAQAAPAQQQKAQE
jgi:predicted small lipoprotein YifL